MQRILSFPDRPSGILMHQLRERCLGKVVFRELLYACGDAAFREMIQTAQGRKELEKEIANQCSKPEWEVFVDTQRGRPLRKGAGEDGPETILVRRPEGTWLNYEDVSDILRFGGHPGHGYVSVYAPVGGVTDAQRAEDRANTAAKAQQVLRFEPRAAHVNICPRCGKPLPEWPEGCCLTCGQALMAAEGGGDEADA